MEVKNAMRGMKQRWSKQRIKMGSTCSCEGEGACVYMCNIQELGCERIRL